MARLTDSINIEQYNVIELQTIRQYLPSEYALLNDVTEIPHLVRAQAWSKAINAAGADNPDIKDLFSEIWNYRLSRSGMDINNQNVKDMIDYAYMTSGSGNYFNQLQPFLYSLDRYNSIRIPDNLEFNGPMFITRPRLCLQVSNLRNHRGMVPLDTTDPNSVAFMIRALLDTNLASANTEAEEMYKSSYVNSKIFDYRNPFMTPLCNAASSVTGLPDMLLETATTAGGFMQEAQQFAIGGDNLHRASYELNINFKDVQYGPIFAIFYYWLEYIRCVVRGYMLPYADDIDQQRINYTSSIYLFNLDPSRQYITKWCKCTGCFPRALPVGAMMNREANGSRVKAAAELSIPFVCNIVEYMDPWILVEFNKLVQRYCHDINKSVGGKYLRPNEYGVSYTGTEGANMLKTLHRRPPMPHLPSLNFSCLPYVTSDPNGVRLEWRLVNKELTIGTKNTIDANKDIDYGCLEFLRQNTAFMDGSKAIMEPINKYFYPGFSEYSKDFDLDQLTQFIDSKNNRFEADGMMS